MPPTSDGGAARSYTVACSLEKAAPDKKHIAAIRDAVVRVHRCTYAATELLNLYTRDRIENHDATGLDDIFKQNWLLNAYHAVKRNGGSKQPKVDAGIQMVFDTHMAEIHVKPDGKGLTQALTYECINLAAVGSTNVWMHFQKRVLSYTRTALAMDEDDYANLTKPERRARKLALMQAADDVCRPQTEPKRSPAEFHKWVDERRQLLGIDEAVGDWTNGDKQGTVFPLLYHLKAKPHRFLKAMHIMSTARHAAGRKAMALFPLRRSHVPGHMRFDKKVLDDLLGLDCASAATKAKAAKAAEAANVDLNATVPSGRTPKRKRDDPSLLAEKAEVFNAVLDLRAAGVHRRHHFAYAFTTDGVSVHLNMERPKPPGVDDKKKKTKKSTNSSRPMPTRGIHSIDALKACSRDTNVKLHTIGIDPGKRELIVAVDGDDPRNSPVVRYTLAQRQRDMRTRQYADELKRAKPQPVAVAEEALSLHNSKAPSLAEFAAFAATRRVQLRECLDIHAFYDQLNHRNRRRKTKIKAQQSEARLFQRLAAMHPPNDDRQMVLAYGAWGLVAGRPNLACNKGNPPAIGVGLMKKLALRFLVAPTPEHYTSKTCAACGGLCGPHPTLKTPKTNREIRGLRVCQNEGCGLHFNRDKLGARNIATQFDRLLADQPPLKALTDEELEFHRLNVVCVACTD